MGNFGVDGSVFRNERTVGVASAFEYLLGIAFDAFGIVLSAEFFCTVVAIFLKSIELASEAAENVNGRREFFGVRSELFANVWLKEKLRELSGSELKADFGELGGVVGAEVFGEIVLKEASFNGAILSDTPVTIAATGFPVGNVAFGDFDVVFVEGTDDFGMRDIVLEHSIDHVADGIGKSGDFASAGFGFGSAGGVGLTGGGGWILAEWLNR